MAREKKGTGVVNETDAAATHQTATGPAASSRRAAWAAYSACVWALLFAAPSFYWAAGGTAGMGTLGPGVVALARDPWFVVLVWATGVAKVLAGLLALALARPWGRRIPRWVLLVGAWGGGALLVFHGGDFVIQGALALGGVVDVPASAPWATIRWYTFLWGPWFLIGGILFCAAAWHHQRTSQRRRARPG
jgi:hypothetical protein